MLLTCRLLRNCNISGTILKYFADMIELLALDLGVKNFHGEIPNLDGLSGLEDMYVTSNSLSGPIPEWIKKRDNRYAIDLSYNNFKENSVPTVCPDSMIHGITCGN